MAWLRQGDGGLPRFQAKPSGPPPPPAPADRAGSGSLDGQGLGRTYSTDTLRSTEEEEELSRELTMELMADLGIGDRGSGGTRGSHGGSRRGSAYPSRRTSLASEAPPTSISEGGGGSIPEAGEDPGAHWDWVSEEGSPKEELMPSLYDQLGGGIAVKNVVDEFYRRVLDDPSLTRFFEGVDMQKHVRKFLMFATYVLGGPDEYLQLNPEPWPQLYAVHEQLILEAGLEECHFDAVKGRFEDALVAAGAPRLIIDQALGVVETTRRIIFPLEPPEGSVAHQQQQQQQQAAAGQASPKCPADAAGGGRCPYDKGEA